MNKKPSALKKAVPFYKSLLGKYLGIALIILLLITSLTTATYFLTTHIQGEAQRINLAGRQRMHLFHIATHAHFLTGSTEIPGGIDLHRQEIRKEMSAYEQTLHQLRENCPLCNLKPPWFATDHEDLGRRLCDLVNLWEKKQKPLLLEIVANPNQLPETTEQTCVTCHATFIDTFDQVDGFVFALARHNDRIIKDFNMLRASILVVFAMVIIGVVLFVRRKMLQPVMALQNAAASMEQGQFPGQLTPRTSDEIGLLTETFNRMAVALSTNIREMEKQVYQRTIELQHSNKELETFVYTVSHDLRAPLRAIEGFSVALREDAEKLSPTLQGHVNHILAAVEHMETLIADLLLYSRVAFKETRPERVATRFLLDQVLRELSVEIEKKAAQVLVEDPFPEIMGDHNTLVQILVNLVSNSLKFVRPGTSPRVRIWSRQTGSRLRLLVTDEGIGIAPADQERIFDVFVRLHSSETYPGTGIGLASVRKGIGRLGGTCGVESTPGRGSTFWVELPLAS